MNEIEPTPKQIIDLKDGLKSSFWETLKFFVEDEIKTAESQMFEDENLDEKQRDALRNRRNNLKYVLEMPELIIEHAKPRPRQKKPKVEVYGKEEEE